MTIEYTTRDRKYTFRVRGGTVSIDRGGRPWVDSLDGAGSKAVLALIADAEEMARELAGAFAESEAP